MIESSFEERILKLEQANCELRREIGQLQQRRRRVWIAGISIIALVAIAGAASFSGDSFQLLHPKSNKQRINFGTNPDGKTAGLNFLDDKGSKRRIFLGHTEEDTPVIQLLAPDGQLLRSNLSVGPDNSVGLHMFGRGGKEIVVLGISAANRFTLQLKRPDGNSFISLDMPEKEKAGGIAFYDSEDKKKMLIGLDDKDEPMIRFYAADGSVAKELRP